MKCRCPYCGNIIQNDNKYVYVIVDSFNHIRKYCSIKCAENGREREVDIMINRLVAIKNQSIRKEPYEE